MSMNRNMMRQAQRLQAQLQKAQEELESMTVEGSAGGGVIKVVMSGKQVVESVTIEPGGRRGHRPAARPGGRRSKRRLQQDPGTCRRKDGRHHRGHEDSGAGIAAMSMGPLPASSPSLSRLVQELHKLPGIGPKSAQRLAYHIIRLPEEEALALADAVTGSQAQHRILPALPEPGRRLAMPGMRRTPAQPRGRFASSRTRLDVLAMGKRPLLRRPVPRSARRHLSPEPASGPTTSS